MAQTALFPPCQHWRQEVGGSAIEASKIAGHASTKITEEYTVVQLKRQDELTRWIQAKLARAIHQIMPASTSEHPPVLASRRGAGDNRG